jgi:hypothetical protein
MPEVEKKKEPGRPVVEQPERGDPRLGDRTVEPVPESGIVKDKPEDRPPARRPGKTESPWLGGG